MRQALEKSRVQAIYDRIANAYNFQHSLLTAGSDQRGRALLVEHAVISGDIVLDCGAGTGRTALLAAKKARRVVLCDISEGMLAVARRNLGKLELRAEVELKTGDILNLPFADGEFDVALSTYSLCPVFDPTKGAQELFRVTKPGGRIGVAHSTEPSSKPVKALAGLVEAVVWRFPHVSLGCRPVSVLPALEGLGCKVLFKRVLGVPLWPFLVFVVQKPETA